MSGEANLSAENSRKPLDGRDSAPNPDGGVHSDPETPQLVERGLPRSRPSTLSVLAPMKTHGLALVGSVPQVEHYKSEFF